MLLRAPAALDLDSSLSRASIVWALGELKASEGLPHLSGLYAAEARRAERMPDRGTDSCAREHLLDATQIRESIGKMGAAALDFFRTLAADPNPAAREQAAGALGKHSSDHEHDARILRSLLADPAEKVRTQATASLLLLGQTAAEH